MQCYVSATDMWALFLFLRMVREGVHGTSAWSEVSCLPPTLHFFFSNMLLVCSSFAVGRAAIVCLGEGRPSPGHQIHRCSLSSVIVLVDLLGLESLESLVQQLMLHRHPSGSVLDPSRPSPTLSLVGHCTPIWWKKEKMSEKRERSKRAWYHRC